MINPSPRRARNKERGQTILLVAVSMITLLGLAALAIDVVTLYVARSEAQRAADAGALAGAKMLVDSGLTTDPCNATLATTAQTLAISQAQAVVQQNNIAGQAAQTITVNFPNSSSANCPNAFGINPQVVVTLQRTGLPTFFSRVWSRAAGSVSAVATAEAYNPSNSGGLNATGSVVPIAPRCAKPMVLPNCDPRGNSNPPCTPTSPTFINLATGAIQNPGQFVSGGVINEVMMLASACKKFPRGSCVPQAAVTAGLYYPIALSPSALHLCPGCSTSAGGFQQDLECCNASAPVCGQQIPVDFTVNPDPPGGGEASNGGQCLIHQNPGQGQDVIDTATQSPDLFIAGSNNPFVGTSIQTNDHIVTSDSIVTIPLYDGLTVPAAGSSVTIIGFLQVFIDAVDNQGNITATVLNVSGCGNSPAGTPLQGAATSVPVRLVQPQ